MNSVNIHCPKCNATGNQIQFRSCNISTKGIQPYIEYYCLKCPPKENNSYQFSVPICPGCKSILGRFVNTDKERNGVYFNLTNANIFTVIVGKKTYCSIDCRINYIEYIEKNTPIDEKNTPIDEKNTPIAEILENTTITEQEKQFLQQLLS